MAIAEKFINRGMPLVTLDEKFTFFANIIEEIQMMPPYWNARSIRINLKKLMDSISQHAQQWRSTLGELLAKRTAENIVSLRNEIKVSMDGLVSVYTYIHIKYAYMNCE